MHQAAPRQIAFVLAMTDHGAMILNRNDYRVFESGGVFGVGHELLRDSKFSETEVRGALELLTNRRADFGDGVIALDCGANIGVHTVEWARAMTDWGRVIAFEAQERIFYALAGNIALNNCGNASAIHAALGAEAGLMSIPEPDYDQPGNFGGFELKARADGAEPIGQAIDYGRLTKEVKVVAIDELALPRLDFLKIDVEGMELEVLHGAIDSLRRHRPQMVVETLKSGFEPLRDFLEPLGYRIWPWGQNLVAAHLTDPASERIAFQA